MNRRSHVLTGLFLALAVCIWAGYWQLPVAAVAAIVGAMVPDIDLRKGHRVYMHNVFVLTGTSLMVYAGVGLLLDPLIAVAAAIGYFVGFLSHILADTLTVRGVALLFPLTRRRFRVASLRSNSLAANILPPTLSLLVLVATVLLVLRLLPAR